MCKCVKLVLVILSLEPRTRKTNTCSLLSVDISSKAFFAVLPEEAENARGVEKNIGKGEEKEVQSLARMC